MKKDWRDVVFWAGVIGLSASIIVLGVLILKYTVFSKKNDNRDLGGLEVTFLDWWTGESFGEANSDYEKALLKMLHKAEAEHDFTFKRMSIPEYGWGQDYIEFAADSILNNNPVASLILLDSRWVGRFAEKDLLLDVSKSTVVNFDDAKWNKAVREVMSYNGGIYGFAAGVTAENVTGVFFNKEIFRMFGLNDELVYDLQKEGKWNWDTFTELCKSLTKDTDNDGVTDIYAVAGVDETVVNAVLVSNDTYVIKRDEAGLWKVNADDPRVLHAFDFIHELTDGGYYMPTPQGDDWWWEWSKEAFTQSRTALYIDEEWQGARLSGWSGEEIDFGFVTFPYGPDVGHPVAVIRENIVIIPNCDATRDLLDDILYAYDWYTTVPEEYRKSDESWKVALSYKEADSRTIDETLRMVVSEWPLLMNPGNSFGEDRNVYWCGELINGMSSREVLRTYESVWQAEANQYNKTTQQK